MFPFTEKIDCGDGFLVDYRDIRRHIGPALTPERIEKIKKVASGRNFKTAIVLENIYDRGNTSAVLRSGEGFGFGNFHVIETGEKFKDGNRTSAGAAKWVEVQKWKSTKSCVDQLRKEGKKIYATHLDAKAVPIESVDFTVPAALVLGNEHEGCSPEILEAADERVILPMNGFVQSYNISVAGALSFYAVYRALEKFGFGHLNSLEKEILEAVYMIRTQDSSPAVLRTLKERNELEWTR